MVSAAFILALGEVGMRLDPAELSRSFLETSPAALQLKPGSLAAYRNGIRRVLRRLRLLDNAHGLERIVRRRTRDWLGVERGPHWFRKCLTTSAVLAAPHLAADAAAVLGHTPQTSLQHYNMATAVAAAARHNERVSRLRRETAGLAERLFDRPGSGSAADSPSPHPDPAGK